MWYFTGIVFTGVVVDEDYAAPTNPGVPSIALLTGVE